MWGRLTVGITSTLEDVYGVEEMPPGYLPDRLNVSSSQQTIGDSLKGGLTISVDSSQRKKYQ